MELTAAVTRVRILVVTTMMVVVSVAAGDVFDRTIAWLVISPLLVGGLAIATSRTRWPIRAASSAIGVVASTALVVVSTGGTAGDVISSFGAGPQRLLSTDWPSPDRPDLIGTIAAALAFATVATTTLTTVRRLHLSPIAPIAAAHVSVIALSAPMGIRLGWILPLGGLAIVFAALRPGVDLRERLTLLRGERRLVPVAFLAIGMSAFVSVPLALDVRADPRRNEPAEQSAALLDPIEATLALQRLDPSIPVYDIEIADSSTAVPLRWRTTALVEFDGRRWSPDLTLRPIGRRLEARGDGTIDATITFEASDFDLVPLPGAPVVVDAPIETDPARTIVRLLDRAEPGREVAVTTRVEPDSASVQIGAVGLREDNSSATAFAELAGGLVEEGGSDDGADPLDRIRAIESTMRDDFLLRADVPGGGLQRALISRFLRDTREGNAEQFSTAFVLLVRSLGFDARVATGFAVADDAAADGSFVLTSADAAIWPEVRVGEQWIAFDPVPPEEAGDTPPEEPEPQVQTPAAPQPPAAAPPENDDEPVITDTDDAADTRAGLPIVVEVVLRSAAVVGAVVLPVLLLVMAILGVKWRRRRRHLSGSPVERIRGAWAEATNRLVDAGMTIGLSETNDEIATGATEHVAAADREIRRLATLASATTFGSPARPDLLAEDATFCLVKVETSMADSRTFVQRARWNLSPRSLRRRTSSPV